MDMDLHVNRNEIEAHEMFGTWREESNICNYMKTGKLPSLKYDGLPFFYSNTSDYPQDGYVLKGQMIMRSCDTEHTPPLGIILNHNGIRIILQNGDEEYNELVMDLPNKDWPTASFNCLTRLIFRNAERATVKLQKQMAKMFIDSKLIIIDYESDKYIQMNKKQKDQMYQYYNDNRKPMPKAPAGFTVVSGSEFHRSATVVVRDLEYDGKSYILGQDEDTYFGCEFDEWVHPTSIKDAFEQLKPREVRGKKGVLRQGEWFILPVKNSQVPSVVASIATFEEIFLPVDHENSNEHTVITDDGRISKLGKIFAKHGRLNHPEHKTVELEDRWYTFYRNTAVRSVSVKGVD